MPNWRDTRQLARPGGVVFFAAVGQLVGGVAALSLAYLYADPLKQGGPAIGALLLIGGALGCGLALLPTHVLSLLCGWALGTPVGLAVALAGATLGSPLGYRVGQSLAGPGAMAVIDKHPRAATACRAVAQASASRAALLIGLLRLSPVVPYGSTNIIAAIFSVPLAPFLLGTLLGLAPRVAAVVFLGDTLQTLDTDKATSPWLWYLGLAATALAVVLITWFAKQALGRAIQTPLP